MKITLNLSIAFGIFVTLYSASGAPLRDKDILKSRKLIRENSGKPNDMVYGRSKKPSCFKNCCTGGEEEGDIEMSNTKSKLSRRDGSKLSKQTSKPTESLLRNVETDQKEDPQQAAERMRKGKMIDQDETSIKTLLKPKTTLSPSKTKRIADFKNIFTVFDIDGDGQITDEELGRIMQALGQPLSSAELRMAMETFDSDRNGAIDFEGFSDLITNKWEKEQTLQEGFNLFDTDGDGFMDAADLLRVMKGLGEKVTAEEAEKMLRVCDKDEDNRISLDEYRAMFNSQ